MLCDTIDTDEDSYVSRQSLPELQEPTLSTPQIIRITAHVRGCLIKSDRSSVACYEVRTIVIHYERILSLAVVS